MNYRELIWLKELRNLELDLNSIYFDIFNDILTLKLNNWDGMEWNGKMF